MMTFYLVRMIWLSRHDEILSCHDNLLSRQNEFLSHKYTGQSKYYLEPNIIWNELITLHDETTIWNVVVKLKNQMPSKKSKS